MHHGISNTFFPNKAKEKHGESLLSLVSTGSYRYQPGVSQTRSRQSNPRARIVLKGDGLCVQLVLRRSVGLPACRVVSR